MLEICTSRGRAGSPGLEGSNPRFRRFESHAQRPQSSGLSTARTSFSFRLAHYTLDLYRWLLTDAATGSWRASNWVMSEADANALDLSAEPVPEWPERRQVPEDPLECTAQFVG
jgi:hypothetical protein